MTVYSNTARFDTGRALTEDEMRVLAPSIFARTAHESRSDRFQVIPTIEILKALKKEGFVAVGAKQSASRVEGKADYTKHMIRLRRMDDGKSYSVGDNVCEILLKNANDGTSAYELMAGLFRIRCLNSLVTQTGTIDAIKVRHSGDAIPQVIEGTYRVLGEAEQTLAAPQDWSNIVLNEDEKQALAVSAHHLRFADSAGLVTTPIKPQQLLVPNRSEDRSNDLWTVFNTVQEHCIKGGLRGFARNEFGQTRRVKTRAVNGIDQDIKLNKALWILSEEMAKIKK
jgi:hypothetical protein